MIGNCFEESHENELHGIQALQVTCLTEESRCQRVAPLRRLIRQLQVTILTCVTVHMIIFVHGNDTNSLIRSFQWCDCTTTSSAFWSKDSVQEKEFTSLEERNNVNPVSRMKRESQWQTYR